MMKSLVAALGIAAAAAVAASASPTRLQPSAARPAPLAPAPAAAPAPATLAEVGRALAATRSLVADFTQTAQTGAVQRGTMSLRRPGRVRFDYGRGSPILVVADGRQLSFIDYQVGQVSQWPLRQTPLGVLLDPEADLSRTARVLPADQSPVPGTIAVLAHDPARPDLGRILFLLQRRADAPGGMALVGWRATDAQNNLTIVELSNLRWNVDVAESTFRFVDPRQRARPAGRAG